MYNTRIDFYASHKHFGATVNCEKGVSKAHVSYHKYSTVLKKLVTALYDR